MSFHDLWYGTVFCPLRNATLRWCGAYIKNYRQQIKKIPKSITEWLSIKNTRINVTSFSESLEAKKCNVPSATLCPLRNVFWKYELLSRYLQLSQCIYFQNQNKARLSWHLDIFIENELKNCPRVTGWTQG